MTDSTIVKNNFRSYSLLYFLLAATLAAYMPYSVMYLNESGIKVTTIGLILSLNSVIALCVRPIWGFLSDSSGSIKKVFLYCLAITIILMQFFLLADSVFTIAMLYLTVTVFFVTLNPLLDSWIIQGIRGSDSKGYGNIRIFGCLAFAFSAYLIGRAIQGTSIKIIFPIFGAFGVITILAAIRIPTSGMGNRVKTNLRDLRRILVDYQYLLFLVYGFLLFIPLFSASSYMPMLMDSVNGTKTQFGLAIFIGSMCEIPIYLSGKHMVRRIGPRSILLIATLIHSVRLLLFSFVTEPMQVVFIQSLNGFALALYTMGLLYYLDELAPPDFKATYLTISISTSAGLSGIIAGYFGGWIIHSYTINHLMRLGSFLCFIAFVFFAVSNLILHRRRNRYTRTE